jgi:RHS repeat-associated protein
VDDQNITGYVQTMEEWVAEGYGFFELEKVYDYGLDLVAQTEFEPDPGSGFKFPVSSFYLYDCHGSVRALTDETGTVTDTYTYDAFGIQLSQQVRNPASGLLEPVSTDNRSLITDNSYRYCGEYFDADSGMYYLRARHMNPETGRFHTLDEYEGRIRDPLSLHKYLYAHANPVMGSDPSGFVNLMDLDMAQIVQQILRNAGQQVTITVVKRGSCVVVQQIAWEVATQAVMSVGGVYIFEHLGRGRMPYTGKSVNMLNRLRSHGEAVVGKAFATLKGTIRIVGLDDAGLRILEQRVLDEVMEIAGKQFWDKGLKTGNVANVIKASKSSFGDICKYIK